MSIPNHLETTEVVLLEVEILLTIISIGAWGGFVSFLLRKNKEESSEAHQGIMNCLTQVVISCFTSFLLSALAIEKGFSFNMVLLAAGLGGVFAGPILKILGEKVKNTLGGTKLK
ncbi:phage protein [Klebsiella aerogenes]|uniref:phage holin family protein n=1 Tax=Klebsiella TaxID=570 RepID=UPI00063C922F|nr:phage holin family protein [Klebsiella aerogenes]KLF16075.1 phage protein [Klebsiella aerogenes]MDM8057311.1 phage holin family protein [Klebsiella aerogenes]MDM8081639.1 phage holin family protein [Klebsiella aerogenes]MDT8885613.1 phage holin family protein [Klebsiella aerogenes]HDT1382468.1 phage holin family protein [Klebsiella aerogenes]